MTAGGQLYLEEIRLPAIGLVAVGMLVVAMVFVTLVFIDPFAVSNKGDSQSGIFWIPASLFLSLAWFAWFMGKFTIIATEKRFSVGAGMNSNSIAWQEIVSAGDDYSRRPPCSVLTAVPTILDGESAMVLHRPAAADRGSIEKRPLTENHFPHAAARCITQDHSGNGKGSPRDTHVN
jgi:hypothetical protein